MTEGQKSALSQAGKMLSMRMMTKNRCLISLRKKDFVKRTLILLLRTLNG